MDAVKSREEKPYKEPPPSFVPTKNRNHKTKFFSLRKFLKGLVTARSIYYTHLPKQDRVGRTYDEIQKLRHKEFKKQVRNS
jgi:hypothetical protein